MRARGHGCRRRPARNATHPQPLRPAVRQCCLAAGCPDVAASSTSSRLRFVRRLLLRTACMRPCDDVSQTYPGRAVPISHKVAAFRRPRGTPRTNVLGGIFLLRGVQVYPRSPEMHGPRAEGGRCAGTSGKGGLLLSLDLHSWYWLFVLPCSYVLVYNCSTIALQYWVLSLPRVAIVHELLVV